MILKDFPFKSTLSLTNLIGYWQVKALDESELVSYTAREIVRRLEDAPELMEPIRDLSIIEKYKDLVDLIMTAAVPKALLEDEIIAAVPPFQMLPFYVAPGFKDLVDFENPNFKMGNGDRPVDELLKNKTLFAYSHLLSMYYGIHLPIKYDIIITIQDKDTGLDKYYRVLVNPKFCEVKVDGELPSLSEEQIQEIVNNLNDLDVWKKHLPPQKFEYQGFSIFRLVDVTEQEVISSIKNDLLQKGSISTDSTFFGLENKLRILFQSPEMKLGVAAFQRSQENLINFGGQITHSFTLNKEEGITCSAGLDSIYNYFKENREPKIISDLSKEESMGEFAQFMISKGIRNVVIAPLFYDDELLGLLELGSPNAGDINLTSVNQINEIMPLFSAAVQNNTEDMTNRIQAVIKEEYTAIHPSVEWRFVDAALRYIHQQEQGEKPELEQIIFENVLPLYGASDIRGSSTIRNEGIKADLSKQLKSIRKILLKAKDIQSLPIYEEITFRIDKYLNGLKHGLFSGDEVTILDFIRNEAEPLFKVLELQEDPLKKEITAYRKALDPNLGIIYEKRKDFEESLTSLNDMVARFLEMEETRTQEMYPHYFEKYKTDGVEYNIYVGASISKEKPYDDIYLKNMRLWQLIATSEIARFTALARPKLKVPLEMSHLILLHSTPLAVRFRLDEKQFDVDGAYNIRYEIVKKRIDKAYVKGTEERLTQPNKIAIVYSQNKDLEEYNRYIEYLQTKGFLTDEVENLELEDLQGVQGLRALRVEVKLDGSSQAEDELDTQNILAEIHELTRTGKN